MFDVKFSPKFARLRELFRSACMENKVIDVHKLVSHLLQLYVPDDQLFISLFFYTRQELWKDNCSLYRALNIPSFSLLPEYFLQLIESLRLQRFYQQLFQLPVTVALHLINIVTEGEISYLSQTTTLELIVQSLLDNSSCNDLSIVQLLSRLIAKAKISLAQLLDSVWWLSDGELKWEGEPVLARFIRLSGETNHHKHQISHQGCVWEEESDTDKRVIMEHAKALIAKQHGQCDKEAWKHLFADLLGSLYRAQQDVDISQICQSHCKITRRVKGYQLVFVEDENLKTEIQSLFEILREASDLVVHSDTFTFFVIHQALFDTHQPGVNYLSYITSNIFTFVGSQRSRELLLSHKAELLWSQDQIEQLLEHLDSSDRLEISQEALISLEKLVVEALLRLPTSSPLIQYGALSQFSHCFNKTPSATLANLSLNKIQPQSLDEQAICTLLTVMLSLNPKDVIKLFIGQILRSKSQLAVVMSKVFMSVMCVSMLPIDVYDEHMSELGLSQDQTDDVLSKCILFLPQFACPVSSSISEACMQRFNLDNEYLTEMMTNIYSCLDTNKDINVYEVRMLSTIGLFTLSVIDSQLMTGSKGQTRLARLALRLLSSPALIRSFSEVKTVVAEVIHSLHPNSQKYLLSEDSLKELCIPSII
ncbi:uncharacterized protein [Watersipora subatra]|uniref:uncharacterized protein n=1 Tax=Watersipora subatra TaxID=2589382 RepID=UPI00355C3784